MKPIGAFASPAAWPWGAQIARVVSVQDPERLARVQVQLMSADVDGGTTLWARVAVPFAGDNRGFFFLPDVGDEVLVVFAAGDFRAPVVIGALWNGATQVPESLPGDRVDRWTITGKNGTRVAIVEEANGQELVEIETPAGARATITDNAGGKIELTAAGNTLTMDTAGVSIDAAAQVSVNASQVRVSAGQVTVDAGFSRFSGVVQCDTLISNTVVSSSYTPGAGNIW